LLPARLLGHRVSFVVPEQAASSFHDIAIGHADNDLGVTVDFAADAAAAHEEGTFTFQ